MQSTPTTAASAAVAGAAAAAANVAAKASDHTSSKATTEIENKLGLKAGVGLDASVPSSAFGNRRGSTSSSSNKQGTNKGGKKSSAPQASSSNNADDDLGFQFDEEIAKGVTTNVGEDANEVDDDFVAKLLIVTQKNSRSTSSTTERPAGSKPVLPGKRISLEQGT